MMKRTDIEKGWRTDIEKMNKHYCDICGKEINGYFYKVKFLFRNCIGIPETQEYCSKHCYEAGMHRMILNPDISEIDILRHGDMRDW